MESEGTQASAPAGTTGQGVMRVMVRTGSAEGQTVPTDTLLLCPHTEKTPDGVGWLALAPGVYVGGDGDGTTHFLPGQRDVFDLPMGSVGLLSAISLAM